jgi:hypothetical protein
MILQEYTGDELEALRLRRRPLVATAAGRSTAETIIGNEVLLETVLKVYPDKIPSKAWLAAICVHINKLVGIYSGGIENVMSSAMQDGHLMKTHLQHVRMLARSSSESRGAALFRLKSVLGKSGC